MTCSTDQTIKFYDPVSASYELTDPSNHPHALQRPGYYKPLVSEKTRSNVTLKEVKRIYTDSGTSCFALRCLNLQGIAVDERRPELRSQVEWIVAMKMGRRKYLPLSAAEKEKGEKEEEHFMQEVFISGYGVERIQIEVPALHVDDVVPPYVLKECEELAAARRRRLADAFRK